MSELVQIRNADAVAQQVVGWGVAEPHQTLAVPPALAAELCAAPAKADPGRKAWELVKEQPPAAPERAARTVMKEEPDGADE